ncbi:MAG: adenylate/guanylate cyclase domain-containing protein [Rhizobiaceae bacterium]
MLLKKANLQFLLLLLLIAAILGAAYGAILDHFIRSNLTANSFLLGALRGLIMVAIVIVLESALAYSRVGRQLRLLPFSVSLIIRSATTTIVLMLAITCSRLVISRQDHSIEQWIESGMLRDFVFVAIVAFSIHFSIQITRIVGGKTFLYFLLGRYNQPVVEQRIFMLIDIVGSTSIAHQLGEKNALGLFAQFFFDISQPIKEYGGETDLYIGDEVVVSWPLADEISNARFLHCYFALCDVLNENQAVYEKKYGHKIGIRVGVHGGPVAVGECGDAKRQVVLVGDTINVAKRLQESCKELNLNILTSGKLLELTKLPDGITKKSFGKRTLRGRDSKTELFTLISQ